MLQAAGTMISRVEAGALLASPTLDHPLGDPLGVVLGKIALGQDPSDDLPYALLGLLVERPTAHLPIYREEVSSAIGDPPTLVIDHLCHSLASICYSIYWVIRAARANDDTQF